MTLISEPKRQSPKIDVVPLIDVLMVLIIFFLVTMQFQDLRAINVKLPKIDSAGSNLLENELIVSIDEEGLFYLNGKPVAEEKIKSIFKNIICNTIIFMYIATFKIICEISKI